AVLNQADGTIIQSFRSQVDCGGNLTRRARHPAICNQRDTEATILQNPQCRGQFVHYWHAARVWTLNADHRDIIFIQLTAFERSLHIFMSVEDHRRGFDYAIFRLHGGHFDDAATEVTFQQSHATFGAERLVGWTEYRVIQAFGGRITPDNFAILQE